MPTETKPCACGCGQLVTRSHNDSGFLNSEWFVNWGHYKRKRKEKGHKMRRVQYKGKISP